MTMRLDMDTSTHPDIGTEAIGAAGVRVGGADRQSWRKVRHWHNGSKKKPYDWPAN
jgi:hypothetical protein